MKTIRDIQWRRVFSAIPGDITIPAGSPVVKDGTSFWVDPNFFDKKKQPIEHHDAINYGVYVDPDNVEE